MHHFIFIVIAFFVATSTVILGGGVYSQGAALSPMSASVFFTPSVTVDALKKKFSDAPVSNKRVRVLIVPGHEPDYGGAEYRDIKERDLAVDLSRILVEYISADPRYEVMITRGRNAWNPVIEKYFQTYQNEILAFALSQKQEMARLAGEKRITYVGDKVPHNDAPGDVALRLYGINKWANENEIDIVLHIHFNDSVPRARNQAGEHSGFAVYVPERQYSNASASKAIAEKIFHRIGRLMPVSSLPLEDEGLVEEQGLIAIGSNNTVDGASMLIEYGYVYEPQFEKSLVRAVALRELAYQTYLGLSDFFDVANVGSNETTTLPYEWSSILSKGARANPDVFAMQVALMKDGLYPPHGATKNDCPPTGVYGKCTQNALAVFQKQFGVDGDGSVVGAKTLRKLNERHGKSSAQN